MDINGTSNVLAEKKYLIILGYLFLIVLFFVGGIYLKEINVKSSQLKNATHLLSLKNEKYKLRKEYVSSLENKLRLHDEKINLLVVEHKKNSIEAEKKWNNYKEGVTLLTLENKRTIEKLKNENDNVREKLKHANVQNSKIKKEKTLINKKLEEKLKKTKEELEKAKIAKKVRQDKKLAALKLKKEKRQKETKKIAKKKPTLIGNKKYASYSKFKENTNLKKSYDIFQNASLLKKATGKNTKLTVDVSEQRIRLYVNNEVALCSPCTTGAKRKFEPNTKIYRDKRTPKGTFKITEKISDKRSTIFGKYYRNGKVVYKGDKRKFKGSKKGLKYQGASLKNWMRLTSSGIGLHASKYVKRYPGTNGCIRLPYKISKTIFKNVRKGTKVSVVN
ncbi:MAG: L,D-transpeptidase [Campylobacterota bacterium]|nr:L,D-transpeptidase [Campylobacterota bacterium]